MSENGTFWLPPASSTVAGDVDGLFYFIYWVSVVSFVLLVGATFYFAWHYRKREGGPKLRQFIHGTWLEVTWSVIPAIILLFIFGWGFRGFMNIQIAPRNAVEVYVTAQKWMWEFDYQGGKHTVGELHVPADRPVKLIMRSKDVLHSFFIPEFRVKADVIPGRYTTLWFQTQGILQERIDKMQEVYTSDDWPSMSAEERAKMENNPTVQVFCTEYCGDNHSKMYAQVIVHSAEGFEEWRTKVEGLPDSMPLEEKGKIYYTQKGCNACHSVDGSKVVGPTFKGVWGRQEQLVDGSSVSVDENYVRKSIREPLSQVVQGFPPAMPAYPAKSVSDEEIDALIAYMKTLN